MNKESLRTFIARRSVRITALMLLVLMLTIFLIQMYSKANRDIGYDFTSYLLSAQALLDGQNPYQTDTPFTYSYPMFLAFLLIPLCKVPYWLANLTWFAVNVLSLLGSVFILVRLTLPHTKLDWTSHLIGPLVLSLLLMAGVIQNNLLNGQVNFVVLLSCMLFLKYFLANKTLPASLFLAMAAAIKLVPLILFLFVLLRRDFRVLALSTVLFVIFCLLPAVTLGGDVTVIYGEYVQNFILGKFSGGAEQAEQTYYTLYGFLTQLLPFLKRFAGMKLASAAVVAGVVAVVDIVAIRRNGKGVGVLTVNLYLLAILLITPLSETHHLAFMMPAVSLMMVLFVYDNEWSFKPYGILFGLFFVCFYLSKPVGGPLYFTALALLFVIVSKASRRPVAFSVARQDFH